MGYVDIVVLPPLDPIVKNHLLRLVAAATEPDGTFTVASRTDIRHILGRHGWTNSVLVLYATNEVELMDLAGFTAGGDSLRIVLIVPEVTVSIARLGHRLKARVILAWAEAELNLPDVLKRMLARTPAVLADGPAVEGGTL
ncbi:MAG: hypothetical protein KJ060_03850 [Candidatus Hydrogenedentes bacterium]|nr:hypothetical protein [Candidatus Hydrogenedentota bacterium]